jgi:hypothetical protein
MLTTQPGDDHIAFSQNMERCDEYQCHRGTEAPVGYVGCAIGIEHSILLPSGKFRMPIGEAYVLADLHGKLDGKAANFMVDFVNWNSAMKDKLGWLQIQIFNGDPMNPTEHAVAVCKPEFDKWYDFRHEMFLSAGDDGYSRSWCNGQLVMEHTGPTVYAADFVYWKIANYHAVRSDVPPAAYSVLHDRVRVWRL